MDREMVAERLFSSMMTSLGSLRFDDDGSNIKSSSISIVPEELKESNMDEAYRPKVVCMGPRFKGIKEDILRIEEMKLRCMMSLIHRAGTTGEAPTYLKQCSRVILHLQQEIRASYVADMNDINNEDLAKMMLIDGSFLLELLISKSNLSAKLPSSFGFPSPARQVLENQDVLSDLILLENQIPIFILHALTRTLFPDVFEEDLSDRATKINNLALDIFGYSPSHVQKNFESPHILDVVHTFVNRREGEDETGESEDSNHVVVYIPGTQAILRLERCASRLQAAGVTIKVAQEINSQLSFFSFLRNCLGGHDKNIMTSGTRQVVVPPRKEKRGLDFQFNFREGVLEIEQLHFTETTKKTWRNIIAWEHEQKRWNRTTQGNSILATVILNGLICCAADVQLLKDKNIIVDHVKRSNEELKAFLHTMSFRVDHGVIDPRHVQMVDLLNNYSHTFFIMRMWKLFWHALQRLVKFMHRDYNFVAAVLAVLTVVQTIIAILDFFMH